MDKEYMSKIKPGDRIVVNEVQYDVIGSYVDTDGKITIIVRFDKGGIPVKEMMDDLSKWNIPEENQDYNFWPFSYNEIDAHIPSKTRKQNVINQYPDGMTCDICINHNPFAEPNMDDGRYICHNCKTTRSYLIK